MSYVEPKTIAAAVRANIKRAQTDGTLDPKWKISVRTDLASLCSSVDVSIRGEELTDAWLFRPRGDGGVQWSDHAVELAGQVRGLMGPALEWEDGRARFAFLYFRDGLCAP